MSFTALRVLRNTRINALAAQVRPCCSVRPVHLLTNSRFASTTSCCSSSTQSSMQPMTADDRPNILSDIKRDHAGFFSLHRRFKEEPNLSDDEKQVIIWQVSI